MQEKTTLTQFNDLASVMHDAGWVILYAVTGHVFGDPEVPLLFALYIGPYDLYDTENSSVVAGDCRHGP